MADKNENSTDATRGDSLKSRVQARKQELEQSLAKLAPDDHTRKEVQIALDEVVGLLTGDLDRIPHVVATELNTWLEASKHVNEQHPGKKT